MNEDTYLWLQVADVLRQQRLAMSLQRGVVYPTAHIIWGWWGR